MITSTPEDAAREAEYRRRALRRRTPNEASSDEEMLLSYVGRGGRDTILAVRRYWQGREWTLAVCDRVSSDLARQLGLRWAEGTLTLPFEHCDFHCWCVFDDWTILDATADQFFENEERLEGQLPGIRIALPGTPEFLGYEARALHQTDDAGRHHRRRVRPQRSP